MPVNLLKYGDDLLPSVGRLCRAGKSCRLKKSPGSLMTAGAGRRRETGGSFYEQPVVLPQLSHFRQVPLRTRVKLAHSGQLSPS